MVSIFKHGRQHIWLIGYGQTVPWNPTWRMWLVPNQTMSCKQTVSITGWFLIVFLKSKFQLFNIQAAANVSTKLLRAGSTVVDLPSVRSCCIHLRAISQEKLNPIHAKFFRVNINMYLHFMSFLRTDKTQVVEIPPRVRQGPVYYIINIMAADVLATQGARASATMILT